MTPRKSPETLAGQATPQSGRQRARRRIDKAIAVAEKPLGSHAQDASPSRVALAKLKVARLHAGLTLRDIAAKTGIHRGNLSKLENNFNNVQMNTLARLADALGYDVIRRLPQTPVACSSHRQVAGRSRLPSGTLTCVQRLIKVPLGKRDLPPGPSRAATPPSPFSAAFAFLGGRQNAGTNCPIKPQTPAPFPPARQPTPGDFPNLPQPKTPDPSPTTELMSRESYFLCQEPPRCGL